MRNPAPDSGESNFGLPQSEITIAEALKPLGYATAAFGKWHLGHKEEWLPRTQGFDEYLGILYSNDMFPVQLVRNETVVEYPVAQSMLTQRYTAEALRFIESNKDRPFFLYLPHAMPHKPLAASDDFYTPETRADLYADVIAELDWSVGGGLRGMKGRTWDGGLRVPMIARMPGVIPPGIVNHEPAASIDVFPTVCALAGASLPKDRIIDGTDIMPMLKDSGTPSPHGAIYGMQGTNLAIIRSGKWKLHVRNPGPPRFDRLSPEEKATWVDPRGPDGVTILAPYEQARVDQHPGLTSGVEPSSMMLFDLQADRAEQHDVADQNPEVVERLLAEFRKTEAEVPDLPEPESAYLFREPGPGQSRVLMRLIGGELRYDRVPESQKHLIDKKAPDIDSP
jgi:uncharacterized sulfatase